MLPKIWECLKKNNKRIRIFSKWKVLDFPKFLPMLGLLLLFCFVLFETGSHYVSLTDLRSFGRPGYPQTPINPLASAS